MLQDLRLTLRLLQQSKAWTTVVLLSLALGIGVNTAFFSVINGLLLKMVWAEAPEELVRLRWVGDNHMAKGITNYGFLTDNLAGERLQSTFSYAVFERLRESNKTLTGLLACAPTCRVNVVLNGQAEMASAILVSGSYFEVLGVPALIGRTILPEDNLKGAPSVAMISHGYWERRFGGNPGMVGATMSVNNIPVTIVGVTPRQYSGIQRLGDSAHDIHLPVVLDSQITVQERLSRATTWWLQIVGRLQPGVTPEQVKGNLERVFQATARAGLCSGLLAFWRAGFAVGLYWPFRADVLQRQPPDPRDRDPDGPRRATPARGSSGAPRIDAAGFDRQPDRTRRRPGRWSPAC